MKRWLIILGFVLCLLAVAWLAGLRPGAKEKGSPQASPSEPSGTAAPARDPIHVYDVATVEALRDKNGFSKYRIRFSVRNHEPAPQTIWANPYTTAFIPGGQSFIVPAGSSQANLEVVAKMIQPTLLVVSCGNFRTNCPLAW